MTDDEMPDEVIDYYERKRQAKTRIAEARAEQEQAARDAREKHRSDGLRNVGKAWHPGALD